VREEEEGVVVVIEEDAEEDVDEAEQGVYRSRVTNQKNLGRLEAVERASVGRRIVDTILLECNSISFDPLIRRCWSNPRTLQVGATKKLNYGRISHISPANVEYFRFPVLLRLWAFIS